MKVYVVMVEDRHIDHELSIFTAAEMAIAYAEKEAKSRAQNYDFEVSVDEEMVATERWLYYAFFSGKDDCIHVQEVGVQS